MGGKGEESGDKGEGSRGLRPPVQPHNTDDHLSEVER